MLGGGWKLDEKEYRAISCVLKSTAQGKRRDLLTPVTRVFLPQKPMLAFPIPTGSQTRRHVILMLCA